MNQRVVNLPDGHSARLRTPDEVTERQRRPVSKAITAVRPEVVTIIRQLAQSAPGGLSNMEVQMAAAEAVLASGMTEAEIQAMQESSDHGVIAFVESWTYKVRDVAALARPDDETPLPVSIENLLDLPGRAYRILLEVTAPMVNDLFLDATPDPDPRSPFGNSNGSGTDSREEPSRTLRSTGVSTD